MRAEWHVRLSRRAAELIYGEPDLMLCAALHRRRSFWCWPIDIVAFVWLLLIRGRIEWGHCRAMSCWEHARHCRDVVERTRLAGL